LTIVTSNLLAEDLERHGIAFTMLPHPYRYAVQRPRKTPTRTPEPLVVGISAGFWSRKNLALAAETFADVLGGDSRYRLRLHTRMRPNDPAERAEHHRIEEAMTRSGNIELTMASLSR